MTHASLASLLKHIHSRRATESTVLDWASPVPYFGRLSASSVATVGLNPSPREFLDPGGQELKGSARRLPTLSSLELSSWLHADHRHCNAIIEACEDYFRVQPYTRWFNVLERALQSVGASFYDDSRSACHLDLAPYATSRKWGELTCEQRTFLLNLSARSVQLTIQNSKLELLILNGISVIEAFQEITKAELNRTEMPAWKLPRKTGRHVPGHAFTGAINHIIGVPLDRRITILGFNHNLQSSFGVTRLVLDSIADWIGRSLPQ